jgi:prevent-host-death family protein
MPPAAAIEIDVRELPARLSEMVRKAREGVEVIVTENGVAAAKLSPVQPADPPEKRKPRVPGRGRGFYTKIADDFDAPLPDDFWLGGNP